MKRSIPVALALALFAAPVMAEAEILAGHGRVEAARMIGMATVPCVRLEHMTEQQKRAYVIADNKIALNAGWNLDILRGELHPEHGVERIRAEVAEILVEVAEA